MSYLQLLNGIPDFNKAVISLWFRVPMESLVKAANQDLKDNIAYFNDRNYVFPRFSGVVPLITFGPMFEGYRVAVTEDGPATSQTITNKTFTHCVWNVDSVQIVTGNQLRYSQGQVVPYNPSFIGIRAKWDDQPGGIIDVSLELRLQMKDYGSARWVYPIQIFENSDYSTFGSFVVWDPSDPCPFPDTFTAWDYALKTCESIVIIPGEEQRVGVTHQDKSDLYTMAVGPEAFDVTLSKPVGQIDPDRWHHVLISFDLDHATTATGAKTVYTYSNCPDVSLDASGQRKLDIVYSDEENLITDPCGLWIALDDIDAPITDWRQENIHGMDDHALITPTTYNASQISYTSISHEESIISSSAFIKNEADDYGISSYSYGPSLIPSSGFPFCIPCIPELIDSNLHVEMAELQIFTGVTLDTTIESNRRAFIDKDGYPIKPTKQASSADPQPGSIQLLGKQPEILLHGAHNWKRGYNTGSLGKRLDSNGNLVTDPNGQFIPTGEIDIYKPDPSLWGPQDSPPAVALAKGQPMAAEIKIVRA